VQCHLSRHLSCVARLELHFFVTKRSLHHITEVRVHPCVRWGTNLHLGEVKFGLIAGTLSSY